MTPHPHAEFLHDLADGKSLDDVVCRHTSWTNTAMSDPALSRISGWVMEPDKWTLTRKPKTHVVNGETVPAPLDVLPEMFWLLQTASFVYATEVAKREYDNSWLTMWLKRGVCFATKEDAMANFNALMKGRL